jgi:FlaG/FlaF family flagellin (archaellin)
MVAITVVLAAVLYVMVMGFGGTSTQTPTGAFVNTQKMNAETEIVTFGAISPVPTFANCQLRIDPPSGGVSTTVNWATNGLNYTIAGTATTGVIFSKSVTVAVTDLASDGKISNGDYVTMQLPGAVALTSGTWTFTLIYTPTGASICSTTFTV